MAHLRYRRRLPGMPAPVGSHAVPVLQRLVAALELVLLLLIAAYNRSKWTILIALPRRRLYVWADRNTVSSLYTRWSAWRIYRGFLIRSAFCWRICCALKTGAR